MSSLLKFSFSGSGSPLAALTLLVVHSTDAEPHHLYNESCPFISVRQSAASAHTVIAPIVYAYRNGPQAAPPAAPQTLQNEAMPTSSDATLVFVYAAWCPNCKSAKPMFQTLEQANPAKVRLIDADRASRNFMRSNNLTRIPVVGILKDDRVVARLPTHQIRNVDAVRAFAAEHGIVLV